MEKLKIFEVSADSTQLADANRLGSRRPKYNAAFMTRKTLEQLNDLLWNSRDGRYKL